MTRRRPGNPPAAGSSPNLLVFPEAFDNAAWNKPGITVTPDYGDATYPTADRLVIPTPRLLMQTTTTAGASGGAVGAITLMASWEIYSFTTTIDGLPYTITANAIAISGAVDLRLEIALSGGFLQGRLGNQSGSTATIGLAWMKLEQADHFTGYP